MFTMSYNTTTPAITAAGAASSMPLREPLMWNQ